MKFVYRALVSKDVEGVGYNVEFPDLPGCFTCGDTYQEVINEASDALKTYLASKLLHGEEIPQPTLSEDDLTCGVLIISVDVDDSYIVSGPAVSAAEAARFLGVSPGRISQMLKAGILDGFRDGRKTYVTVMSLEGRKSHTPLAGRPAASLA